MNIRANEMSKIADIAANGQENSPIQVGIGGYADPRDTDHTTKP